MCGPIDATYVKVATETGGQPFPLSTSEIGKSSRVMQTSGLRETILSASAPGERSYSIPIDSTVERVMFSGTFDATGGSLTVVAPDGTVVQQGEGIKDTPLNCGRIITVDAPARGMWQVRATPSGYFWLLVHAKSDLSLTDAAFVEQRTGADGSEPVKIEGEPIAGRAALLRVGVSSDISSPTFQLVSLDARSIQQLDLQSVGSGEFRGMITLPIEAFRVLVTGLDESGMSLQRISSRLFHAEPIEVIAPAGETVRAGTDTPLTFTIRNHGPAVRVNLVASDMHGQIIAVDPPTIDLAAGEESTATVGLTVPADAPPESKVSIRLTETSDQHAAVGGFNSASKTLTVIRE
jgi:hypothetical protein